MNRIARLGVDVIKFPVRKIRSNLRALSLDRKVSQTMLTQPSIDLANFDFQKFKAQTISFLDQLRTDQSGVRFRYSLSCDQSTLYSSIYACMTLSLLGELDNDEKSRAAWVVYFDSFQHDDGLF